MDDVVTRLSRELASALAAAVADDHRVEACHERAKAAGYDMKVSLEAVIGFANRPAEAPPADLSDTKAGDPPAEATGAESAGAGTPNAPGVMSSNDRRFLRSLRIAADETSQKVD